MKIRKSIITLYTPYVEVAIKPILKKEATRIISQGMSELDYGDLELDLLDSIEFGSPVYDDVFVPSISVVTDTYNEESHSLLKLYNKALRNAPKVELPASGKREKFCIVSYQYYKRAEYFLHINGEFDIKKLSLDIEQSTDLRTQVLTGYSLTYNGEDFELDDMDGSNYNDFYLLSSTGQRYPIEINEDQ
jgi:hypothetical protein